ncbi:hypothetical protein MUN84_02310 [Hymenobacter sp. 5516J-16]|uniref:hypothetical protein n=1 Tax=Hymenobacter sp. 5516J-16 TaxID=2932253 RepID=UPI001FD3B6F5|nr:hypothetical protein [Hymenobacter sp. 5516J-16]UOQ77557.1 hypothetical protein MUN84_02310 [Hymenobacter sp. 5516J-16]
MLLSQATTFHRFALRQSLAADGLQHLALFSPEGLVAHWLLVPTPACHGEASQPHLLLTEAPAGLALPTTELDAGSCRAVVPVAGHRPLHYLCLHIGGAHLRGQFAVVRLQPGSATWLFGPVPQAPAQRRPGRTIASSRSAARRV